MLFLVIFCCAANLVIIIFHYIFTILSLVFKDAADLCIFTLYLSLSRNFFISVNSILIDCLRQCFLSVSKVLTSFYYIYLFSKISFSFREKGRQGERGGEKHQCARDTAISCLSYVPWPGTEPAAQARALTENWTSDLLVSGMIPSPLSHTSQCRCWAGFKEKRYFEQLVGI